MKTNPIFAVMNETKNHPFSIHWLDQVPTINNLLFFDRRKKTISDNRPADLLLMEEELAEKTLAYHHYIEKKCRRAFVDIYASFQPFNEATRAAMPFLARAKEKLKADDKILVLWDRSGWVTQLVASLFPEQQVITTWEGNKDVLGYAGFNYWFKDSPQHNIVFCDHAATFPIKDESVSLIVGLDFLHRYDQMLILKEVVRMIKPDGGIVFPHVHLSNSEPVPYFDRGGHQRHGLDYQKLFDLIKQKKNFDGFIFSEPALFTFNDLSPDGSTWEWKSVPDTTAYNALAILAPPSWTAEPMKPYKLSPALYAGSRILINPLLTIKDNRVILDYKKIDGQVGYLLDRHIPYIPRIKPADGFLLNDVQQKIVYWSEKSLSLEAMAKRANKDVKEIITESLALQHIGLIDLFPISEQAHRQQNFQGSQKLFTPYSEQHFSKQWEDAVSWYGERPLLVNEEDESTITFAECDEIVKTILQKLLNSGLKKGDKLMIVSHANSEAILLTWACLYTGIVVVPVNYKTGQQDLEYLLSSIKPALIFASQRVAPVLFASQTSTVIGFDEEVEENNYPAFSDWLDVVNAAHTVPAVSYEEDGIILFSSGSTGKPKGIRLSQGHVLRSGRLMAQTYDWQTEDRVLALGGLETMSGFRNTCIVPVLTGAAVVVPSFVTIQHTLALAECIQKNEVTIVAGNPSLYHQFNKLHSKIGSQLDGLKKALSTGSKLSTSVRQEFQQLYKKTIYNYYGLTETSGICTAELLHRPLKGEQLDSIGLPVDAVFQIVDAEGKVLEAGETGELRLYSENIFLGYHERPDLTEACMKDGWFYTGDIAKVLESGDIQLLGRTKEMIKTNTGIVVFLEPINELLMKHPKVEQSAVVSYLEDEIEKMAAFIVSPTGMSDEKALMGELRSYLETEVGKDKLPNLFISKQALPFNSSNGKLLKQELTKEVYAYRGITP
ncbi:MAG: AMP-binding protein [Cytophagaceae bacterium]|nr:AMP-binding protein [Cytophagaceae bacterium]